MAKVISKKGGEAAPMAANGINESIGIERQSMRKNNIAANKRKSYRRIAYHRKMAKSGVSIINDGIEGVKAASKRNEIGGVNGVNGVMKK
jgi:hypothetical protein